MEISRAYLVGVTRQSFRAGDPAKITGAVVVKPKDKLKARLCFQVEFEDGRIDYIPVSEYEEGNVEIRHAFPDDPFL